MNTIRKFLWTGTWILTTIGVLMVLRRLGILAGFGKWLISPRFPFDSGLLAEAWIQSARERAQAKTLPDSSVRQ